MPVLVAAFAALAAASARAVGDATPPVASPALASKAFCTKVGATGSVVRKIFGAHATPMDFRSSTTTYCQITPANAPTTGAAQGCSGVECTDVFIAGAKSTFAADVAYTVTELKEYGGGHVSKRAVAGAGAGAVLVTDTHYGDPSEGLGPVLFLQAGSDAISIQGSLGGPPVFPQWEKLARAIHARLG